MALPHIAGLPPGIQLEDGATVNLQALDPTTGDPVAGVQVNDAMLTIANIGGGDLSSGAFQLVPGPGA